MSADSIILQRYRDVVRELAFASQRAHSEFIRILRAGLLDDENVDNVIDLLHDALTKYETLDQRGEL